MTTWLRLYIKSLVLFTILTFTEKLFFTIYYRPNADVLNISRIMYALLWGIRFDLAIGALLSLAVFLISYLSMRLARYDFVKTLSVSNMVTACLLIAVHGADLMYYGEAGRHLGYEMLQFGNNAGDLLGSAIWEYQWVFLSQIVLGILTCITIRKLFNHPHSRNVHRNKTVMHHLRLEVSLAACVIFSTVLFRGGVTGIPMEPLTAQEIGDSTQAVLALNGAYNAFHAVFSHKHLDNVHINYLTKQQEQITLQSMYPLNYKNYKQQENNRKTTQYNVVIILLEGWDASYMKSYGYDKDVTPFFDKLRTQGLTSFVTIAGGNRTTEGMFSTFCSIQNPLGNSVVHSPLQSYPYDCLPDILRKSGYTSAFFQGTNKNTSGVGSFAQEIGFIDSYGKSDIKEPRYPFHNWGAHDPDVYDFALAKMRIMKKPFLAGINTNSTHGVQLPQGVVPFVSSNSQQDMFVNTMHFADHALNQFISNFPLESLGPTLFVLVADHTRGVLTSIYDTYRIPMLIYAPDIIKPRHLTRAVSQRDIAPTVMDILGISMPSSFAGKSMLRDDEPPYFAEFFNAGYIGWIEGDLLMVLSVKNPAQHNCYKYRDDTLLKNVIPCGIHETDLLHHAMAFTQRSQTLLFKGHTSDFKSLIHNN
ncbi:MAG: sulfatase-like hydrolase/transferase [Nitrospirae bacterium]|nr:sulfatase-like hydrolase/transferase [Nitrospirota bacterium]